MTKQFAPIYAILLAAGRSSRMGRAKPLLNWHGRPLVCAIATTALMSRIAGLFVVVGAEHEAVVKALEGCAPEAQIVYNRRFAEGQATSLQAGIAALPAEAAAALILLVDQPLISAPLLESIMHAYREGDAAVVPVFAGQRGNPVIIGRSLFGEIGELSGDVGARPLLQRHSAAVRTVIVDDRAVLADADTPEAFTALGGSLQ